MSNAMKSHVLLAAFACALPVSSLAANPCCAEEAFQGVGVSPDGVVIQLVEVKRVGPDDVRVTWTLRNSTKTAQRLTKGGSGWSDGYHLSYDAELLEEGSRTPIPVAKDSKDNLLAAKHPPAGPISGIVLPASKTLTTWARFVVPAAATKVTVTLPGAATPVGQRGDHALA